MLTFSLIPGLAFGMWRDTVPVSDMGDLVIRFIPSRFTGSLLIDSVDLFFLLYPLLSFSCSLYLNCL